MCLEKIPLDWELHVFLQVGVSDDLYHFIHDLWLENQPIGELSWQTYALDFGAQGSTSSPANLKENDANAANELPCSANML